MGRSLSVARLQATTEGKPQDYIRATFVSRMRCTISISKCNNSTTTMKILSSVTKQPTLVPWDLRYQEECQSKGSNTCSDGNANEY
uniref:Uncharacterized protein n=1 Tax=Oryza nivara TaxID=4536 RepID=A0A0E0H0P4_ORYNI